MNAPRPFFLVVADTQARTFTIEGPMSDETAWEARMKAMRGEGREVYGDCVDHLPLPDLEREAARLYGRQLPAGSIVALDANAAS